MDKTSIFLTKTAILGRPGWSKTLAERLLGEPDQTRKHSTYGTLIALYDQNKVLALEKSPEYLGYQDKLRNRRVAASKAVETKKSTLIDSVEAMEISVSSMSMRHVKKLAIKAYNEWNQYEGKYASDKDDKAFLERITVNYIRHELSEYDQTLYDLSGKTGSFEARDLIWKKIFSAIAIVYPDLATECFRQLEAKLNPQYP